MSFTPDILAGRRLQVALSQEANRAQGKSGVAEKKSASPGNKSSLAQLCEHFGYPVIALLVAAAPAKFLVSKNNNLRGHIMLLVEASIVA